MNKKIFIFIFIFSFFLLSSLVEAQLNYNNPKLPRINSPVQNAITIVSSGNSSGLDSATANATYIRKGYDTTSGGINYSTQGFCGIDPTFGVFGCRSYGINDLWISTENYLNREVISQNTGSKAYVVTNYYDWYTGETSFGLATLAMFLNNTRLNIHRNLSLQNQNLLDWIDGDCPTGNYSYGLYVNGTFKCRSDTNGSGGGINYYLYNQTNLNYNTSLLFNTSSIMEAGYTGTAGSFATLTYLVIGSGTTSVSTSYNNRVKNVTYTGWVRDLKVVRNSAGAGMNVTLFVNGSATTLNCRTPAGTFVTCQNLTESVRVRDGDTWAVGIIADNSTTLSLIGVSFEYIQEQSVNFTTNVNVSAPVTPFTRNQVNCNALDSVFFNNRSIPISVQGSIDITVKATNDQAEIEFFVGSNPPATSLGRVGIRNNEIVGTSHQEGRAFNFEVGAYENYTLTSYVAGSGTVTLNTCSEVTS